ncbi:hypothetical protein [Streptomyces sp. NPDC059071]|uniref:hypothetical protein n=1 Tax=unclassified Streptomyces TaxID=2593676 RepID=UPI00364C1767
MSETSPDFPADLLDLQQRLHQARRDFAVLCAGLPWSVEPDPGWPGTEHPHTGEVTGGRPASPGWTDEQRAEHARLLALVQELSIKVTDHAFWASLPLDGSRVMARSQLKHHPDARPAEPPAAAESAAA